MMYGNGGLYDVYNEYKHQESVKKKIYIFIE